METSALNGDNIDKGFEMMFNEIFKKYGEEIIEDDDFETMEKGDDINLEKANKVDKKGCC